MTQTLNLPRPLSHQQMLEAADVRGREGLLTIAETADRYGINRERIAAAVLALEVASVTFTFTWEGTELVLVPTTDGAVAEWLAAQA